ncbi:MAG: ABC transporter [Alphaproteobacteria bacterium HGW-Alphaproteobacteria-2]|nr:MAG: ABC transporter [Alphaproteobacteria bacterium HGW-Alphaproteobacteria-2]
MTGRAAEAVSVHSLRRSDVPVTASLPVLSTKGLSLVYDGARGQHLAVDNVGLEIAQGERLVLLGPSGCGKSTILKAVAGFHSPASGTISLRGKPVSGPGPDRVVVFQEFDQLLPWKTALGNVMFPLLRARKLSRTEARQQAEDALERVGLTRALNQFPHELSGGMKQRVAIARALAMRPDVLLMDEPFAALDALTRSRLQADLLRVVEDAKATLLFVTHSIEEALLIGTRLHLLSAHPGRTLATLDVAGLIPASPAFTRAKTEVHDLLFPQAEAADV